MKKKNIIRLTNSIIEHKKSRDLFRRIEETNREFYLLLKRDQDEKNDKNKLSPIKSFKENNVIAKFTRTIFGMKNNKSVFNLKKHELNIDIANRNIEKNRIEQVLKKVALNQVKVKSKLSLKRDSINILKEKIIKQKLKFELNNTMKKNNLNVIELRYNQGNLNRKRYSVSTSKIKKRNYYVLSSGKDIFFKQGSKKRLNRNNSSDQNKKRKTCYFNKSLYDIRTSHLLHDYSSLRSLIADESKSIIFILFLEFLKRNIRPSSEIKEVMGIRKEMKLFRLYVFLLFYSRKQKYKDVNLLMDKYDKNKKSDFINKIMIELEKSERNKFEIFG